MHIANIVIGSLVLILFFIAFLKRADLPIAGLKASWQMFLNVLPMLAMTFILAGLIQVIVPKEVITRLLGKEAGFKGILLGCLFGAITPGGPITAFPIAAVLYKSGAGIGTMVSYMSAWSLWALTRMPMEIGFMGWRFTLIRFLSTFFFPPLAGWMAQLMFSR